MLVMQELARPHEENRDVLQRLDLAIVILNYNTVHLLQACLRSLYASVTGYTFAVWVVDNGSTDGSLAMVHAEFPQAYVIANDLNIGYSAGNNVGLRKLGFVAGSPALHVQDLPRFVLLLNPDTLAPPTALADMLRFMEERPTVGAAGPRVRRPDGSLDRACRRSFPTPLVSFFRMTGLSRLFPKSRRFNAYNLEYLPETAVHPVDSVVGAFMLIRREAILQAGLLDESFFMYGEDLDWAKRIKDAGWEIWYNGQVEITHVKEAASSQSSKSRIDFYEAMWIFYRKHYQQQTPWLLDKLIMLGIMIKGGLDVARHLWHFCRNNKPGGEPTPDARHTGNIAL
jgi:N-acetylglucosaminyl-diphospho-decaprenol L-rhamnosyltransferase